MKYYFAIAAAFVAYLNFSWVHADSGAVEPAHGGGDEMDVAGWRGLAWGTPASEAAKLLDNVVLDRQQEIEVGGCFFTRAVPLSLKDEAWQAWLCEDRKTGDVIAVSLEKGFRGVFFGDDRKTELFETFLAELTAQYGPAHLFWNQCHNARWNQTVQYKWVFPTTTVTLLVRDVPDQWVSVRFEQTNNRPDFGPGVCVTLPRDLRG